MTDPRLVGHVPGCAWQQHDLGRPSSCDCGHLDRLGASLAEPDQPAAEVQLVLTPTVPAFGGLLAGRATLASSGIASLRIPPTPNGRGLGSELLGDESLVAPHLARIRHRADVLRVREAILGAEHPIATLRWLVASLPPQLIAEALDDDDVRAKLREPFIAAGEVLARFAEAMSVGVEHALGSLRAFHDSMREAGMLPDEGPTEPRARALWLRQHRSTGPTRVPAAQQRRPRGRAR